MGAENVHISKRHILEAVAFSAAATVVAIDKIKQISNSSKEKKLEIEEIERTNLDSGDSGILFDTMPQYTLPSPGH